MTFTKDEIPDDVIYHVDNGEIRCKHYNPRKKGICNKLLARGKVTKEPLEFKCPNCGNKSTFVKA